MASSQPYRLGGTADNKHSMNSGNKAIGRILLCLLFCCCLASAQATAAVLSEQQDRLVKSLSFIYAPILGTGYYKAGAEQAFVLKLNMDTLLEETSRETGPRWLLPVTLGVRRTDFDTILENGLPDELHSLSIMPGLAWDFRPHPDWLVVPSAQLGVAKDFSVETSAAIYSANLRALGRWRLGQNTLSWGNRIRLAGQYNLEQNKEQGFVLLETGLDLEFAPNVRIGQREASFSVYTQLQSYNPNAGIRGFSGERIDTRHLIHLGMTLGLKEELKILGVPFRRVGISVVRGDELKAISLNLGFPLSRD